ncbi:hypothetical protein ACFL5F_07110 [Planctomycetota bacterium]
MRKLVIGFVSLCAVLGAYLLYNRISGSPSIDTDRQVDIIESAADANAVDFGSEIGKIGDVGLGPVNKAYYATRNLQTQEIVREFGFEKLLNEARDIWDIEKPYMNIYRRNFKCLITADKGKVQVETAVGRTTPKDATFSSNVVVHILSGPPDDVKESFVYLDNFVFLSDRSRLSTAGPVKFVSEDVRMNGTGLELIYNEQTERLEYFKITDLESLQIKSSQAAMFFASNASKDESQTNTQQPDDPLVVDDTPKVEASTPDAQQKEEQKQGVYYKCTFSKNVLVNSPEQLIFADDKLCINDIFWSKSSADQPDEVDANSTNEGQATAATAEHDQQTTNSTRETNVTATKPADSNIPSEQLESIVVTCDNGFVVVPRDSARAQEDTAADDVEERESGVEFPDEFDNDTGRTKFYTRRIDYNATTGDGIANGLSELTFYTGSTSGSDTNKASLPVKITARNRASFSKASNKVVFEGDCLVTMPQSGLTQPKDVTFSAPMITVYLPEDNSRPPDMFAAGPVELVFYDPNSADINQEPIPVTVNAQEQARFLAASNQIVFEGNSRCTMVREDPNVLEEYMLLSDQITVDLPMDMNDRLSGPAAGIKHLTASGDVVRLATTKTAKAGGAFAGQAQDANSAKLLGGVELKCSRFDYDAVRQIFLATGPGVIKLNNSKAPEPNEPVGRFSMQKPGWTVLEGFETLTYFVLENRIIADAGPQKKLRMDYFPAVDGRYDEHISAKASHVETILFEGPEGQTQLSTLTATGGIEYEDKDNQFIGSELFYDHETTFVKVKGDESQPCYYNGALVEGIEMNEKTGKVKAEITSPGTIQINR